MDMRKSGLVSGSDSGAFTDLNRLNNLKVGDRESDGNMRKVAQEFESLFLNEMLKSMRSANEVLGKDNPLNTPAAKQYQEMYDQQLSVTLSRQGGGIGLADVLMRQMSKNKPAVPGEAATAALSAEVKTPAPVTPAAASPFVRSSGQRPLWASRVATTAVEGGHKNDVAMLNQRRLALPNKLTDRLLAGIVPSADPARSTLNTGTVPGRTSTSMDAVIKGSRHPMLSAGGVQGRLCRHHVADGAAGGRPHRRRSAVSGGAGGAGNRLGQIGDAPAGWQQQPPPVRHQGHRQLAGAAGAGHHQ